MARKILLVFMCVLILISQVTVVKAQSHNLNDVNELLKSKVRFVNPIDAFAMYAFMNYTGYDDENHTSYHPVREGIRNDLNAMNINISRPNYFKDFGNYSMLEGDMSNFIGWLGEPPSFVMDPKMRNALGTYVTRELSDLDDMLTEFYKEAEIDKLYKKYKPYYDEVIHGHEDKVYEVLSKMVKHFNLDIEDMRDFDIFINLQDMYWRGYMFDRLNIDSNTEKPYLLQIGPEPNNGINIINIAHEFSHVFISPIIREKPSEFNRLFIALSYEYGNPTNPDYQTWDKIVDESFVRAMSIWATNQNRGWVTNEVGQGFVMTDYIYNRINDFKSNPNLNFNEWVLNVMNDYASMVHDFDSDDEEAYNRGYEDGYNDGQNNKGQAIQIEDRSKYSALESKKDVPVIKDWSVKFNLDLDISTIIEKNIFVTDSKGVIHSMLYLVDSRDDLSTIKLMPTRNYLNGETYTLWIKDIKAKNGSSLAKWTCMDFTIEK